MSRIADRFAALAREGRGALVTYLQAYDPDPATSLALLRGLPGAGADVIEVGVPFTDPMADGPSIQKAALRALKAGATLSRVLALVRDFRREEADEIEPQARAEGLDLIRLIAPTTDDARLPRVLAATSGFVYYVSITGITGTRSARGEDLAAAVPRIRRHTGLPVAIGFGIRTPGQAAEAARIADGAAVGTALVDTLAASLDERGRARPDTVRQVLDQVRGLAEAVRAAR